MSLLKSDRGDVGALHALSNGTGSNLQSDSSKRSHDVSERPAPWKNPKATPIPTPRNSNGKLSSSKSRAANPLSQATFNDLGRPKPTPQDNRDIRKNPSTRTLVTPGLQSHHSSTSLIVRPDKPPVPKKPRISNSRQSHNRPNADASTSSHEQAAHGKAVPSVTAQANLEIHAIFSSSRQGKGRKGGAKHVKPGQRDSIVSSREAGPSEVINIDEDEDEDIGESISHDLSTDSVDPLSLVAGAEPPGDNRPLNGPSSQEQYLGSAHSLEDSPSISRILGVSENPFLQHPFAKETRPSHSTLPPPGPNTSALKARGSLRAAVSLHDSALGNDTDSIEDADSFDDVLQGEVATDGACSKRKRKSTPSGITEFTPNLVHDTVAQYERRSSFPEEVDLQSKIDAKRSSGMSKIKAMKLKARKDKMDELTSGPKSANAHNLGKPPAPRERRKHPDPIATSSTDFQNGNKHVNGSKEILLPIEAWVNDIHIIDGQADDDPLPRYWLCARGKCISILNTPILMGERLFEFELGYDINRLELPRSLAEANKFPLLVFGLRQTDNTKSFIDFETNMETTIAVKLLTSHANWKMETYEALEEFLKSGLCAFASLDCPGLRARWETFRLLSGTHIPSDSPWPAATTSQPIKGKPKPRPTFAGSLNSSGENLRVTPSSSLVTRGTRRSTRQSQSAGASWLSDRPLSPPAEETILLYPPTGTGAVNVTRGDLKRLEPGEYLNDTLIEFGLKLWLNNLRLERPEFAEEVHVFSSFFYTQLNQKNLEEGYKSVRKWTSKFDLFKKKYIVVPINEHLHWYLAIICHPERTLQRPAPAAAPVPNVTTRTRTRRSLSVACPQETISILERSDSMRPPNLEPGPSSSTSAAVDEQEVEEVVGSSYHTPQKETSPASSISTLAPKSEPGEVATATESEGEDDTKSSHMAMDIDSPSLQPARSAESSDLRAIPPSAFYGVVKPKMLDHTLQAGEEEGEWEGENEDVDELDGEDAMDVDVSASVFLQPTKPDEPYIFSFDSLGSRHPHALKVLSRYLVMEAEDKKGLTETVPAITKQASVPAQPNYCDCGVYLLHFVEQFMSNPEAFSRRIADHTKSKKANEFNKLDRERLWHHDAVSTKREWMKHRLVSLADEWKREKEPEGKGKGKAEEAYSNLPAEHISVDRDSDIEVVEVSPEPPQPAKSARLRTPASHRAQRIR